jgi:hypothetical protein
MAVMEGGPGDELNGRMVGDPGYISWWVEPTPVTTNTRSYKRDMHAEMARTTRTALSEGRFDARPGQREVTFMGEKKWAQDAHRKIKLPGLGAKGVTFGLDLLRMYEWWQVFQRCPHPRYKKVSTHHNCASVAAAALRVGGADQFVPAPGGLFYLSPNQIADWADRVSEEIARRNQVAVRLANDLLAGGEVEPVTVEEVMGVPQWTQLSNQNMRGLFLRSDRVKAIDRLLGQYHGSEWSEDTFNAKMELLGQLLDTIHQYLAHKPGSKRGDAVLTLAKEVLCVAKANQAEYCEAMARKLLPSQYAWVMY